MAVKLTEQTNGPHIYMRLRLDSGRVEEIDAYTTEKGWHYVSTVDLDELLRHRKALHVGLRLFIGQAFKAVAVSRSRAEEEGPSHDVVDSSIAVSQRTVRRQVQQLSFIVADQGDRFLKWIDRLNGSADELLHGSKGIVDVLHDWFLFRFHNNNLHEQTPLRNDKTPCSGAAAELIE